MMPLPPDIALAMHQAQQREVRIMLEQRQSVCFFAAIVCTCDPWYGTGMSGMQNCPVHGTFVLTTKEMLG